MTNRYRKRPIEIDAIRWTGENIKDVADFTDGHRDVVHDGDSHSLLVSTPEGRMRCMAGDWLIRGVEGEYYPCRDSIFQATYEDVDALETA